MNPFDLRGPDFLFLYLGGLAALIVFRYVVVDWLVRAPRDLPRNESTLEELSGPELAYLAGDLRRAVEAAVVGLLHRGWLELRKDKVRGDVSTGRGQVDPISSVVLDAVAGVARSLDELAFELWRRPDALRRLREHGLIRVPTAAHQALAVAPFVAWLLFGAVKVGVGIARDRPVMILMLLVALTIPIARVAARLPASTIRARRWLALRRRRLAGLRATARTAPQQLSGDEHAIAYALFGAGVLAGAGVGLAPLLASRLTAANSSCSTSCGSGSSCSSGSSCGSGSGCGGCSS